MGLIRRLRAVRTDLVTLVSAVRDPRTPRIARVLAVLVVAYAVSPIDLIPDPIPVLGLLDDAILLPIGMLLVRRLIPDVVLEELRARPPALAPPWLVRMGVVLVVLTWIAIVAVAWLLVS